MVEYSIIIAAPDYTVELPVLASLNACGLASSRREIILALGHQPARQRNHALTRAQGKIIIFLDSDSEVPPDYFTRLNESFAQHKPDILGGPVLLPDGATALQRLFQTVLSHPLVVGATAARYSQIGSPRESSEAELILCNLAVRTEVFTREGGFNEALYPNEENEWLDRIAPRTSIWHDPELIIHRRQRATWEEYFSTLTRYGAGRMRQTRISRQLNLKLLPLVALLFWLAASFIARMETGLISFFVGLIYTLVIGWTSGSPATPLSVKERLLIGATALSTHFFYALGQLLGLTGWPPPSPNAGEVHLVDETGQPLTD